MNTNIKARHIRLAGLFLGLAIFLTASVWADSGPVDTDSSYSFVRVAEGPSTVIAPSGERDEVESHMPLFVGDRLWVPGDSRLELVLADRGLLRVEGDAEIDFTAIAHSADTDDRATELELRQGEVQLVVPEDALGESLPVIDTPDATIYVHEPGTFRITVSRQGWTELVVRDGRAEIVGDRDASLVHAGDMAVVEGGSRPYFDIRLAGSRDSLERWGERLSREASYASVPHVDRSLHYVAAPLAGHGVWVTIGGRSAWRPRAAHGWRPYHNGYWRSTRVGLVWVSHDPWGHLTHHYGLWDYVPGYGWVWYPGRTYRTAWVHWYWGPSYVGWCPSGYYASYHGHGRGRSGLTFGIYGYAGGSWSRFAHWSFTASAHFGRRGQHRHVYSGEAMGRVVSTRELSRGIITTDPGAAGRKRPKEIVDLLESEIRDYRRTSGRDLPDVSDFVARKPLPSGLREAIVKPVVKPRPVAKPKPATGSKPSIVSREFPGSSSRRKDPGRVSTRPPRDPMPRADDRARRGTTVVPTKPTVVPTKPTVVPTKPTVVPTKPSPAPARAEKPEDRGREREIDLRDLRERISRTPPPRETPRVKPRSDDERVIRTKPRAVGREREAPRAAPRPDERVIRTKPRAVGREREAPRAAPRPEERVIRTKPRAVDRERESSKPKARISTSKPSKSSKPALKSSDRGKSSSAVKKSTKSRTTAKKSERQKKN